MRPAHHDKYESKFARDGPIAEQSAAAPPARVTQAYGCDYSALRTLMAYHPTRRKQPSSVERAESYARIMSLQWAPSSTMKTSRQRLAHTDLRNCGPAAILSR